MLLLLVLLHELQQNGHDGRMRVGETEAPEEEVVLLETIAQLKLLDEETTHSSVAHTEFTFIDVQTTGTRDQHYRLLETKHVAPEILVIVVHPTVHFVQLVALAIDMRNLRVGRHRHRKVVQVFVLHDETLFAQIRLGSGSSRTLAFRPITSTNAAVKLATNHDRKEVANMTRDTIRSREVHTGGITVR